MQKAADTDRVMISESVPYIQIVRYMVRVGVTGEAAGSRKNSVACAWFRPTVLVARINFTVQISMINAAVRTRRTTDGTCAAMQNGVTGEAVWSRKNSVTGAWFRPTMLVARIKITAQFSLFNAVIGKERIAAGICAAVHAGVTGGAVYRSRKNSVTGAWFRPAALISSTNVMSDSMVTHLFETGT